MTTFMIKHLYVSPGTQIEQFIEFPLHEKCFQVYREVYQNCSSISWNLSVYRVFTAKLYRSGDIENHYCAE